MVGWLVAVMPPSGAAPATGGSDQGMPVMSRTVDADDDVDVFFAYNMFPNKICLGDGSGGLSCSDVAPPTLHTTGVAVGDVDRDG